MKFLRALALLIGASLIVVGVLTGTLLASMYLFTPFVGPDAAALVGFTTYALIVVAWALKDEIVRE